jgi:short-subunit dehydrogenase
MSAGVVVITGGSSGIGRCTAIHFARMGWRVGVIARGEAGLDATADDIRGAGAVAATAVADVADSRALKDAATAIAAALGTPDIWINCAGNGVYGQFADVTEDEFDRVTAVTYGGTVHGCRIALEMMAPRHRGTIVNVCSGAAFHGLPLMTSYAGAKAAVRGFAQALRAELRIAGSPIRVATVFPPAVNTPFFAHAPSHMAWPARPAPCVYQPEVVAAGIYVAAMRGQAEMLISGTVTAFALMTRLSPGLAAYLMVKLGFDRQQCQDSAVLPYAASTLFAPLSCASPVHGAFGHRARRRSLQMWVLSNRWGLSLLARLAAGAVRPPKL